jgi:hypothetical protein
VSQPRTAASKTGKSGVCAPVVDLCLTLKERKKHSLSGDSPRARKANQKRMNEVSFRMLRRTRPSKGNPQGPRVAAATQPTKRASFPGGVIITCLKKTRRGRGFVCNRPVWPKCGWLSDRERNFPFLPPPPKTKWGGCSSTSNFTRCYANKKQPLVLCTALMLVMTTMCVVCMVLVFCVCCWVSSDLVIASGDK